MSLRFFLLFELHQFPLSNPRDQLLVPPGRPLRAIKSSPVSHYIVKFVQSCVHFSLSPMKLQSCFSCEIRSLYTLQTSDGHLLPPGPRLPISSLFLLDGLKIPSEYLSKNLVPPAGTPPVTFVAEKLQISLQKTRCG